MHIDLPDKVRKIIETMEAGGYEAYAVGGCIRDSILGRIPDDWDITTSASPQEVKRLFCRTIDTGIQHGTVTVMIGREGFEVTTYRIDGEYEDGRHPKEVTFTSSLIEDLKRRDFTINAMAYNEKEGLVDVFGGMEDIENRLIRCVGDPRERFGEDALRMMRAVRFSAQLGYAIEEKTKAAVKEMAGNLSCISAERIQSELVKLLISPHPDYLRICYETGITRVILPEFDKCMETEQNNPHHCYTVGEHILHSLEKIKADKVLRLAMLFHDIGKPETKFTDEEGIDHFHGHARAGEEIARRVMKRLRFGNATRDKAARLVWYHDYPIEASARSVRRAVNRIGEDIFPCLFDVKRADIGAQSGYRREEKTAALEEARKVYEKILENRQCVSLRTLAVTGRDLIDAGMEPGKEIGRTLEKLLQTVLENPEENTKEKLLEYVREMTS